MLWVGDSPWNARQDYAVKRQVMAWARIGAPVIYLDPDPGVLQWPVAAPTGRHGDPPHTLIWRSFMTWWIRHAMRSDGPVWVLPWVRRIVTADGQLWTDAAAVVEGLAEQSSAQPVLVALQAGRWVGRSPAVSVAHRPECLGPPPDAGLSPQWLPWAPGWQEPWTRVALAGAPSEAEWARSLAQCLPDLSLVVLGADGDPKAPWPPNVEQVPDDWRPDRWPTTTVRRWSVLAVGPERSVSDAPWISNLLSFHPDLLIVGRDPTGVPSGRVEAAATVRQYSRRIGMHVWLPPSGPHPSLPWQARWRALTKGACPRCQP